VATLHLAWTGGNSAPAKTICPVDRPNALGPNILEVLKAAAVRAVSAAFSVGVDLIGNHSAFEAPYERPAFLKR